MNILFFTVANKRSRDIESQALEFANQGHCIFLLTLSPRSVLHEFFESKGFSTTAHTPRAFWFPIYLIREIFFLASFCKSHRINIIHSHLDPCNLISVFSQPFLRAKVIATRHHADAMIFEASSKYQRISKWIYQCAKHIVAVSPNAKQFMVTHEKVKPARISVIPLSFNFELYEEPDPIKVKAIRDSLNASFILCSVGRFTSLKRMDMAIELIYRLNMRGYDVKLILVGGGDEESNLRCAAKKLGMADRILFTGFIHNVLDYLSASDCYVHFSLTEATCTTVKEAALVNLPAIVCNGVGDFNDYIQNGVNSFLIDKDNAVKDAEKIVVTFYNDRDQLKKIGVQLGKSVRNYFDIKRALPLFNELHKTVIIKD